jgi:hypothetical protein
MPEEIMIISVVAIVFGTGLTALVLTGIYKLIMAKINQGDKGAGDINPQFFKALGEFKKNTERRLSSLEEVFADIEEEEVRSSSQKGKDEDGNLRNMLNE